jgi:hypothetical protein
MGGIAHSDHLIEACPDVVACVCTRAVAGEPFLDRHAVPATNGDRGATG